MKMLKVCYCQHQSVYEKQVVRGNMVYIVKAWRVRKALVYIYLLKVGQRPTRIRALPPHYPGKPHSVRDLSIIPPVSHGFCPRRYSRPQLLLTPKGFCYTLGFELGLISDASSAKPYAAVPVIHCPPVVILQISKPMPSCNGTVLGPFPGPIGLHLRVDFGGRSQPSPCNDGVTFGRQGGPELSQQSQFATVLNLSQSHVGPGMEATFRRMPQCPESGTAVLLSRLDTEPEGPDQLRAKHVPLGTPYYAQVARTRIGRSNLKPRRVVGTPCSSCPLLFLVPTIYMQG